MKFCTCKYDNIQLIIVIQMGNKQPQGFSQNFNMEEYNRKLRAANNYLDTNNSNMQGQQQVMKTSTVKLQTEILSRKSVIYKSSAEIKFQKTSAHIKFPYSSQLVGKVQIYLGVKKVEQDSAKKTIQIQSIYQNNYPIKIGEKLIFDQQIKLNSNVEHFKSLGIVIKIVNSIQQTEYTFTISSNKHWKAVIQKYDNGSVCYLEDVYSGGQGGQQCVVCMADKANTMVNPCKHICLCTDCSSTAKNVLKVCPICRKKIMQLVTIC